MNKLRTSRVLVAGLLVLAPLASRADTFFTDNFSNGSTTNGLSVPGGTTNASSTSYDFASSKNTSDSSIAPSLLRAKLNGNTTSGYWEVQALFTTNAVVLTAPGDYVDLEIVFTNSAGTLFTGNVSPIWIGLYNSGGNPPVAGALAQAGLNTTSGSTYATGNCQLWAGYVGQVYDAAGSRIITRPQQTGSGTTSANQELLGSGVSGGTFTNPRGTTLATSPSQTFTAETNSPYTVQLRITLNPDGSGSLIISNALYSGVGTGGPMLMSNTATATTPIASGFDGLAFGAFNHNGSFNPQMDVSSITVTGQRTAITTPPDITSQPVPVTVPSGGSCAFNVSATGFNMTYQWHRDGTNLVDGGNISGSTSPMLIISPASAADVASGANGYYVTVTGAGGFTTNSDMVSLSLGTAKNLTWTGPGATWDLNTSANWQDSGGNSSEFNYGDAVTFNGGQPTGITLSGSYLSASSVTVEGATGYAFSGSGGFAGPGALYLIGGFLDIANVNTYTGGTVISNSAADLYLENYNGLGTGPVTMAGGLLEIVPAGSGSLGIPGEIVVADDSTIDYNAASSSYSAVFLGNLSGTAGKTLTVQLESSPGSGMDRVRLLGNNTSYNGNLSLPDSTTLWAAYGSTQAYNGVISGSGAFMQKGTVSYLNGANTYSGGTFPVAGSIGLGADSSGNPVTAGPVGTGPLLLTIDSTTSTTGHGELFAAGGAHTVANPIQYPSATNNLTLILGGTNALTLSGPFTLNGNDGTSTYTNRIVQVTATALATLSGVISDGGMGFGLTKTGAGALALTAAETYTGPTTVGGGALLMNGSLASGTVTVTNGVLGGSGTIAGAVTVQTAGTLSPGNSNTVTTLTINNNLSLAGNLLIDVNKSLSPNADSIVVSGTLANSGTGTLTVNNLGPALAAGDTFHVFNKALSGGSSITVTGAGAVWNNNLASDGTISVASVVVAKPVITSTTLLSGNAGLVFNVTNGVAGTSFYVLSSTNLALPISQWTRLSTNVFGAGGTLSVTNPVTAGLPQTFYLLQLP